MRASLAILAVFLPLLTRCDKPPSTGEQPVAARRDTLACGASQAAGTSAAQFDQQRGFEALLADGTRANLAGRPEEAEKKFRAAIDEQEKQVNARQAPACKLALPRMSLGLQLSNAGQYVQAEAQFAQAEKVLDGGDAGMRARLLHYRGIDLLNQHKPGDADGKLAQAQGLYQSLVPTDVLDREPMSVPTLRNPFDPNSGGVAASNLRVINPNQPSVQPNLLGLIEVLRYRAIAMRTLGRRDEAEQATAAAARIAAGNGLARPSVYARVFRTSGVTAGERTQHDQAFSDLARSDSAFEAALPGTRPAAEGALTRARQLVDQKRFSEAQPICRRAVRTLIAIRSGTTPELMAPCLDAYAAGGRFGFGNNRAEMFEAAQVAQGTITSHQIAQASVALTENARDPAVGKALRTRAEAQRDLDKAYRDLDTLGPAASSGPAAAQATRLRQDAAAAQTKLTQADETVRKLSPNYEQLVQDVVPASAVFARLHRGEAFVAIMLSEDSGWTFVLRDGDIAAARIDGGTRIVGNMVKAIRKSIELAPTGPALPPPFDPKTARDLYKLVLGGVDGRLEGATSVVFAPTGPLLSLPFELLLTDDSANPANLAAAPWLVRKYAIAHVPAVTNFVGLRKVAGTSAAKLPWFGFGDFRRITQPQAEGMFPSAACGSDSRNLAGLPDLIAAKKELLLSYMIFTGSKDPSAIASSALLGENFTADNIVGMGDKLKNYKVLQFAAHALLPGEIRCQTEAAIIPTVSAARPGKGEDQLLTASKILRLDLDADLVILSACNSGGPGNAGGGESLSGLARSFFFVKARSLMVTHWSVDDQYGGTVAVLTLTKLKKNPELGVAGGMRAAQLELLDLFQKDPAKADKAHPFYWAPFAVIGDGGAGA